MLEITLCMYLSVCMALTYRTPNLLRIRRETETANDMAVTEVVEAPSLDGMEFNETQFDPEEFKKYLEERGITGENATALIDERGKRYIGCGHSLGCGHHGYHHHHHPFLHGAAGLGTRYLAYQAYKHGFGGFRYPSPYYHHHGGAQYGGAHYGGAHYGGGHYGGAHYGGGHYGGAHYGGGHYGGGQSCVDRVTYCHSHVTRCHDHSVYSVCPRTCSVC